MITDVGEIRKKGIDGDECRNDALRECIRRRSAAKL